MFNELDAGEYTALSRALQWLDGFGFFFVECTPAQGQLLIKRLSDELRNKKTQVLSLTEEIPDLRKLILQLADYQTLEVLFLVGLEQSFTPHIKAGYGGEGDYYREDSVPPVLGRLNLDREIIKSDFPHLAIVCILPKFGIKYFIRRAPDFFDWRSGFFHFATEKTLLTQLIAEKTAIDYDVYLQLSEIEKQARLLELVELLEEPEQDDENKATLHREIGIILESLTRTEEAIASYDKAIAFKPDYAFAWRNRGVALANLGRNEEAIASYDKAIALKPDYVFAWRNRGTALVNLGRYEEAIASYDKAIAFKPDDALAWYNRGSVLDDLGRNEEAIASYDKAIAFKPDDASAWNNHGFALANLGRNEEAIASYDKAIAFKPDYVLAWNNRGNALANLGRNEEAIASYDKAIAFKPDYAFAWRNRGIMLANLGRYEEAIASYDKAIALKLDYAFAWDNRGFALAKLGHYEEAIASYDKAIALKPDDALAWNGRGSVLWKQGKLSEAEDNIAKALVIEPSSLPFLCTDIELALVQQDFVRMQQRLTVVLPLLKPSDETFVIVPFLQWLSQPTESIQPILTAIQQVATQITWDFGTTQPAIDRLTPEQQHIARAFIDYFQNKIDFITLQQTIEIK
ncbi:tetratricopeptide repeat protein [Beggiatoa leptomitoformis]|uniref:Tetratricopeptide repeat protein n=1 Tax=Beggiatoa leptomitoformis TaxID=288004 RepID=A0A2N9YD26_9GAMM|nr:tetratricopeptide repeat protein [Beggiatoa leptomitoformis]AUI68382.1 tetratricopeptide repeat protein [Beggiatoa leptomitoformis]QGX03860.1 tetratricopeptide repeat protein [Beggiatoa leptomitoformis]